MVGLVLSGLFLLFGSVRAATTAQKDVDIVLDVVAVLALTVDKSLVELEVTPTPGGAINTAEVVAKVSTNNATGYTLTMSSKTMDNSLVHTDTVTQVPSLVNATAGVAESLTNNTWGYNAEPGDTVAVPVVSFLAIPLPALPGNPDTINDSTGPVMDDATIVTFGARANLAQKPGVYAQVVIFSAVANYVPPVYEPMQEFTTSECSAMEEYSVAGHEVMLRDLRDNKAYLVRKLADGNCWMVDNLALTPAPAASMVLDDVTSDIGAGTYVLNSSAVGDPHVGSVLGQGYCMDRLNGSGTIGMLVKDAAGKVYNHGCGRQYNWNTATTGSTLSFGVAPNSICPKNWRLPTNTEFSALAVAVGWWSPGTHVINNSPWRGIYSGYNGGNQGENSDGMGIYWTSVAATDTNVYYLYYTADGTVSPNHGGTRWNAHAMRCLVR